MDCEEDSLTDSKNEIGNFLTPSENCSAADNQFESQYKIRLYYESSQCDPASANGSNNVEKVTKKEPNWAELPHLVLERIYLHLAKTDQSNMSLVCSRWSEGFSFPAIWKNLTFILPNKASPLEMYPEVKFARKYGDMFKEVEIIFKDFQWHLVDVTIEQLKLFLQAIETSSQLISIQLFNLNPYLRHLRENSRIDLIKSLISFFNSQKYLKKPIFYDCYFRKQEAMAILHAVIHSNTITELVLRMFSDELPSNELDQQYKSNLSEVCSKFFDVKSIEIDYNFAKMLEEIISYLYENLPAHGSQHYKNKYKIRTLTVFYMGCEDKSLVELMSSKTWTDLQEFFQDCNVILKSVCSHRL